MLPCETLECLELPVANVVMGGVRQRMCLHCAYSPHTGTLSKAQPLLLSRSAGRPPGGARHDLSHLPQGEHTAGSHIVTHTHTCPGTLICSGNSPPEDSQAAQQVPASHVSNNRGGCSWAGDAGPTGCWSASINMLHIHVITFNTSGCTTYRCSYAPAPVRRNLAAP